MNVRALRKTIFWVWLALPWGLARGAEPAPDDAWLKALMGPVPVGQAQRLTAGDREFAAIYTEQLKPTAAGAVILLHDTEAHPDWPTVIAPLRRELPDHGWATLALQMPSPTATEPPNDYPALLSQASERIKAGMEFLRAKGIQNVVLAGHGLGAVMGAAYLAGAEDHGIAAFVAIGIGTPMVDAALDPIPLLGKIKVPVLDLYGSRDLPAVTASAKARAAAAGKAGNTAYRQFEVLGAGHFFTGLSDTLVKRVYSWLHRHARQTEQPDKDKGSQP